MTRESEGFDIRGIKLGGEPLAAAEARAAKLAESCHFNESVAVVDALLEEVAAMNIAARFSRTKKVWETAGGPPPETHPMLRDLSEADYKREQLLRDLRALRQSLVSKGAELRSIVMDMEATKTEG